MRRLRPAQRGPGLASRQRGPGCRRSRVGGRALNEGRDSRPGNGTLQGAGPGAARAQRGPGLASRQRRWRRGPAHRHPWPLNEGRDSRPGNGKADIHPPRTPFSALNEGRDSRPGNGCALAPADLPRERRSTRAGTRVPATGPSSSASWSTPVSRSTRAGTRVPATVDSLAIALPNARSAQRGPGLASRQRPRQQRAGPHDRRVRSTRAGTRVPATAA